MRTLTLALCGAAFWLGRASTGPERGRARSRPDAAPSRKPSSVDGFPKSTDSLVGDASATGMHSFVAADPVLATFDLPRWNMRLTSTESGLVPTLIDHSLAEPEVSPISGTVTKARHDLGAAGDALFDYADRNGTTAEVTRLLGEIGWARTRLAAVSRAEILKNREVIAAVASIQEAGRVLSRAAEATKLPTPKVGDFEAVIGGVNTLANIIEKAAKPQSATMEA